jgi:hypothetical protein
MLAKLNNQFQGDDISQIVNYLPLDVTFNSNPNS